MSNEPNHTNDRFSGGGQPYTPGPTDWRRRLLVEAERIVRTEEARASDPPEPGE